MTTVTSSHSQDGYLLSFNGHAGDTSVCNGVSTLIYTLLNWLDEHGIDHRAKIEPGDVMIRICDGSEATKLAVDIIMMGFRTLSNGYPENVVLK